MNNQILTIVTNDDDGEGARAWRELLGELTDEMALSFVTTKMPNDRPAHTAEPGEMVPGHYVRTQRGRKWVEPYEARVGR